MTGENPPEVAPPSAPSSAHKFHGRLDPATLLGDFWLPDGRQIQEQFNTQEEFLDRWEELTGQRVTTNADSKGFKLFAEVPAETAPPPPATEPIKSRPSKTGIDWEALEAARDARFAALPPDATDDELAARNAEIDASNQLPGRMVPLMDRWNGRKWVVWKERWIADEDLARFTKKPMSASVSTRAGRSELRPGPTSLGSIPKDDKKTENPSDLGSIPKKPASPVIPVSKGRKLNLSPSRGKQESWTITADEKNTFRIRLTESGYAVVLRWTETDGKRPERYCCYLSKGEWAKAKRGSLESLAALIGQKVEQRIASGEGDGQKLGQVLGRIQSLM